MQCSPCFVGCSKDYGTSQALLLTTVPIISLFSFRFLRRLCLRCIEGNGLADELLERSSIHVFSFGDINRAARVAIEAGVEQLRWILQRRALDEGQLHLVLVRFTGADDAAE